jgi:hypothetical protein
MLKHRVWNPTYSAKPPINQLKMWKYFSIQCCPICEGVLLFWKVPRLSPFVLLVRETRSWRCVWNIVWKEIDRGKPRSAEKYLSRGTSRPQIVHCLAWDRTGTSVVIGWRLTIWVIDGFGGLVVCVLASSSRVRGFEPGRSRWIFFCVKNPRHTFLRRGS